MNTISSELAKMSLGLEDASVVEEISQASNDQKDLMGDLPDWNNMSLDEIVSSSYFKFKKNGKENVRLIESRLKDGTWYGKNIIKGDAVTDSLTQLAKRELTMLKFLPVDQVEELRKFAMDFIGVGESHTKELIENSWENARDMKLAPLGKNKELIERLLKGIKSKHTVASLYKLTQEITADVKAVAEVSQDPSAVRKQGAKEYLAKIQKLLGLKELYGRPQKFFSNLYWLCLFGWDKLDPSQIFSDCADRYIKAIKFMDAVENPRESIDDPWYKAL